MAEDLTIDGQPAQPPPVEESSESDYEWREAIKKWPAVPPGLPNRKFECYRNVILVMLFHTPLLVNRLDKVHRYGANCKCLACRFHELFNQFWQKRRPEKFNDALRTFWEDTVPRNEDMDGPSNEWLYDQQDAQEYLASLLSRLTEDETGRRAIFNLPKIQRWPFSYCSECKLITERQMGCLPDSQLKYMIITMINREVEEQKRSSDLISLEEALADGLRHKRSTQMCGNCNASTNRIEGAPLRSGPLLLFVRIFIWSSRFRLQLDPYATISVYPKPDKDRDEVQYVYYELYGVIFHESHNLPGGHYHGGFLGPEGKWAHFNDDISSPCSLEGLQEMQTDTTKVSLLAYRKLGAVKTKIDAEQGKTSKS